MSNVIISHTKQHHNLLLSRVCVLPEGHCVKMPPLPLLMNSAGQNSGRGPLEECIYTQENTHSQPYVSIEAFFVTHAHTFHFCGRTHQATIVLNLSECVCVSRPPAAFASGGGANETSAGVGRYLKGVRGGSGQHIFYRNVTLINACQEGVLSHNSDLSITLQYVLAHGTSSGPPPHH